MPAANDHLASAVVLSGASGSVTMDFTGASYTETGSPDEATWWGGPHKSLWFRWTAPADGEILFALGSGAPAEWDIAAGPDAPDWDTFIAGPSTWSWQGDPLDCHFPVTNGDTYLLFVDDYSYELGSPPSTAVTLTWEPYTPPPPAPFATTWTSTNTLGFGSHTLVAGVDDATVTGTDLDTVSTVTVGGVSQPFDVTSPTELVVHITNPAVSGTIVVANITGSDPATGSATVLYAGPWIQPTDVETSTEETGGAGYGFADTSAGANIYPTQPDIAGEGPNSGLFTQIEVGNQAFPDVDATEFDWHVSGALIFAQLLDGYAEFLMPPADDGPIFTANPDAVEIEHEATAGTAVTDIAVQFGVDDVTAGEWTDDVDNKDPDDLTGDLWTTTVQYRRVPAEDWAVVGGDNSEFVSGVWPSKTAIAALDVDFESSLFVLGETLTVDTVDDTGLGGRVDNRAMHFYPDPYDIGGPPLQDGITITWAEFEAGVAWLVALSRMVDATVIAPPFVDATAVFPSQSKTVSVDAELLLTWTYRPPRYRLYSETPPVSAAFHTLRRRQQAAAVGSAPRRRQIANRAGSLRRGPGAVP